jgi:hypothetical protein
MILLSLPTGRQAVLKQTVKKQSRVALFLVILLGTQKKNPGVGWSKRRTRVWDGIPHLFTLCLSDRVTFFYHKRK